MPGRFVLASVVLLLAVPAAAAHHPPPAAAGAVPGSVMVLDLKMVGVNDRIVKPTARLIEKLIVDHGGTVMNADAVQRAFKKGKTKARGGCEQDMQCIGAVARQLQASAIVSGSVAQVGEQFAVKLTVADPEHIDAPTGALKMMSSLDALSESVTACLSKAFKWDAPAPPPPEAAPPEVVHFVPEVAPVVATGPRKRIAVLDLQGVGVPGPTVSPLTARLVLELKRHGGFDPTSTADAAGGQVIETARDAAGCTSDDACLPEIAKGVGTDLLLSGSVGLLGQSYVVILALTDPKVKNSTTRASETVRSVQELPDAVTHCLTKVFKWLPQTPVPDFHLPANPKPSFALLDLAAAGLSPELGQTVNRALRTEVKDVEGATVLGQEASAAALHARAPALNPACDDAPCVTGLGSALGVDHLITGDAGRVGVTFVVNLRLYDAHSGGLENLVTEGFEGDALQTARAVRHAVRQLLGLPELGKAKLTILANATGADVYVDGDPVGSSPLPLPNLTPGRHEVKVSGSGYFDWRSDVYADPAESGAVLAQLESRPPAWYNQWWVWTIVGGVVAAAAVTTAAVVPRSAPPDTGHGTLTVP